MIVTSILKWVTVVISIDTGMFLQWHCHLVLRITLREKKLCIRFIHDSNEFLLSIGSYFRVSFNPLISHNTVKMRALLVYIFLLQLKKSHLSSFSYSWHWWQLDLLTVCSLLPERWKKRRRENITIFSGCGCVVIIVFMGSDSFHSLLMEGSFDHSVTKDTDWKSFSAVMASVGQIFASSIGQAADMKVNVEWVMDNKRILEMKWVWLQV